MYFYLNLKGKYLILWNLLQKRHIKSLDIYYYLLNNTSKFLKGYANI